MVCSIAMTDVAHTSGLPNPPTGEIRLLDLVHWVIALYLIHWLAARVRELAAGLDRLSDPAIVSILARAAALRALLLARRPTRHGFPIEARRAVAAAIEGICRDIERFRAACRTRPTSAPASRVACRGRFQSGPCTAAPTAPVRRGSIAAATGPPNVHRACATRGRGLGREGCPIAAPGKSAAEARSDHQHGCPPGSFSRRAPAFAIPSLDLYQ